MAGGMLLSSAANSLNNQPITRLSLWIARVFGCKAITPRQTQNKTYELDRITNHG
jgi:hypothetical protein